VFEEHDTFIFGRMDDCHVCLPGDNLLSRHHFILEVNPPDARLRDLGSKNGTYVNGRKFGGRELHESPEEGAKRKYPEIDLHNQDEIKAGNTVFRFEVDLPAECIECGTEIPQAKLSQCIWIGGTYICASCREKLANRAAVDAHPSKSKQVRCQQCGRDVSGEIGAGRRGAFICATCRENAPKDPLELLKALLNQGQLRENTPLNVPDYDIEKKLGEGGMGAVYLARHKQNGTLVALKVMLSKIAVSDQARENFMREIENTRALTHKNIVEFIGHGTVGGIFYFLLEYCEGGSVEGLMEHRGGRLSPKEAGPIMLQALEGLAFAHGKSFVHRDLKPPNILLAGIEKPRVAKIADLGMAKNFEQAGFSGMTATGSFGGTFPFMAREQVTNFKYFKPVSDVWSIGATFYNMLTGQFPRDFRRGQDPMEIILHGDIIPIRKRESDIPKRIAEVIDRSIANNTRDRYQNAGEMRKALEQVL
jgi:DNA-directed RNA polymerase subunit RPC12/RpoP